VFVLRGPGTWDQSTVHFFLRFGNFMDWKKKSKSGTPMASSVKQNFGFSIRGSNSKFQFCQFGNFHTVNPLLSPPILSPPLIVPPSEPKSFISSPPPLIVPPWGGLLGGGGVNKFCREAAKFFANTKTKT